MNKQVFIGNIDNLTRQRNVFLLLSLIAIASCLFLSLRLVNTSDRVILVPGLQQEVWTTDQEVSSSYLEETSSMYLPMLLDLDCGSIDWKRDHIMKYVSHSDERYMKSLNEYFATTKAKYQQFSLSTHFAVKKFEVNPKTLQVRAHGQLTSRFGERGLEILPAIYGLEFEWVGGKLLLTKFVKLTNIEGQENVQE
jgi:type IV conjugative transfer system protein TraE